jgi:ABC-2 type transport system ATP-binding protein
MIAINTQGLTKKYKDVVAVNGLSLSVEEDEIFALLGVNGAGKTTTIKMLSTLISPTAGSAEIFGLDVSKDKGEIRSLIGVSPQDTAVAPALTVKENLEFMAGVYGVKDESKIHALIDGFGLKEVLNRKAKTLSGGWQRKLSIALALVNSPKLLFLDEPTLGLDVLARRDLWRVIKALKNKATIVLTTHYLEEAESLATKVGIMSKGSLVAFGTVEEIKTRYKAKSLEEAFVVAAEEANYAND